MYKSEREENYIFNWDITKNVLKIILNATKKKWTGGYKMAKSAKNWQKSTQIKWIEMKLKKKCVKCIFKMWGKRDCDLGDWLEFGLFWLFQGTFDSVNFTRCHHQSSLDERNTHTVSVNKMEITKTTTITYNCNVIGW